MAAAPLVRGVSRRLRRLRQQKLRNSRTEKLRIDARKKREFYRQPGHGAEATDTTDSTEGALTARNARSDGPTAAYASASSHP